MQTCKVNACCAASRCCGAYDKHLLTLVSVGRHEHVLCSLSALPSVCLCVRPATTNSNVLCCLAHMEREHRDILAGPIRNRCLPSPRLPLAPVSGSWIRPSSRWSVGWEVDTAFIGQRGSTNHRPVSSQMPSGAPGARSPPAHAASALPHCTTTRTTARLDYQTTRQQCFHEVPPTHTRAYAHARSHHTHIVIGRPSRRGGLVL